MNKLIANLGLLLGTFIVAQTANALVVTYDFTAEASAGEGGYSSYTTDGDSAGAIILTATGSNFAGTTDYFAYLDDVDTDNRPAGLGVCADLVGGDGSDCADASDDSLNSGMTGGEMLTVAWNELVTINQIVFRNGIHGTSFFLTQDFEVRIDGGAWMAYSLVNLFTTPLTGSTFDFIVDDTYGNDGCTDSINGFCADRSGSVLYIASLEIETPEPGMIVLFLLGIGLVVFSARQRQSA